MKWLTIIMLVFFSSVSFAHEESVPTTVQEDERILQELLASNLKQTPYSALVQVISIERKKSPMLYPSYLYHCRVLDTYSGKAMKYLDYLAGLESPPPASHIGKTYIVSCFIHQDDGIYYIGDNGYQLPATAPLLKMAKEFKAQAE